ncbi:DNA topoisomerase 2 isoform X2 [Brachypodium distachyon]|uniref:DNA topoisomerase 2 n=1 Tax=Brachypodium distachyon TaxID=15368 RepID=I1ICW7_BRADI|nr:DNA topoisomerase 2 isoform X2 [Brachypodium distachyon]KQK00888.1 hypothetical protein BRADI_3g52470v3 [Brachypodium distachyon]|eukprot:XP_010235848.1 DNA topoisomerase 2 isoform X2 [Brachypodium distachyon]
MAAAAKKPPLKSSSSHNSVAGGGAGKTIEEMYQKKTQLEHILLRPDTYIGSVEKHTQPLWVYDDGAMVHRPVTYVPGLYKIFDEILVNAADNKQRDPKMDSLRVFIDVEGCCVSVYNNGDGIPVEIHQAEGVYVPEMIFGHLLTSSNYNDNEQKTTGGRNGYGAKLTNIFSTEFTIETADGHRQKKYKQVFSENMGKKSEPEISKCKQSENWTRVTFKPDLAKFNMAHLEDDVVALMKKRVVDMAGTLGKTVKVELNGQKVPAKSFLEYVNLYIDSASKDGVKLPSIYQKVNDRWEVCVSLSEGQFQQVSFVNGIATIRGGTHVDYVANQIATHVMAVVNKKNKQANMKLHTVKGYLWVFVNALIDNPAFDSQTKETLTTRQGSFGSKCDLSDDFLKKVADSGVVSNLLSWADFKLSKELKKTDGSKRSNVLGIPKLEDANDAGGRDSDKCTLILTEGDSAKALAMAGRGIVGNDHYGVFPLRGKLLNVREATHKQMMENAEIQNIKKIIGLQHGKEYNSTKDLRYGHLMIMTDQDHDGSHIKGLLINFIHSSWPSLLKVPSFLVEFITPIIKATNKRSKSVISFYSMPDYEAWKERLGANASAWSIKYYKGLGTSTADEGREYFEKIAHHRKDFVWADDKDGDAIELAFSKKRIADRKDWLSNYQPGTCLDQREKRIKYSDFINKELILFSMADLERSIPSMVDGLKPGQRKILFSSFKRNLVKEIKVAQFIGYVSEHSAYHHGEQSLASTILGMAQDYVGSNNISLLEPRGQFGTRNSGGKDAASARYIYTRLPSITRIIFPKDDDVLLNYLNEDGQSIEPTWYMPIIPMVLVNGSEGIGTGWSTYTPNYNPRDIVANLKRLLNDDPIVPMDPWYKGFKGSFEKTTTKAAGVTYTISGIIEAANDTKLIISELPVRRWTLDYKEFLLSMCPQSVKEKEKEKDKNKNKSKDKDKDKDKNKEKEPPFLEDLRSQCDDSSVYFELTLSEKNMAIAMQEGLEKKFKLTNTMGTTNMHLFDSNGKIRKYDTPEEILQEFFTLRLEFYGRRKITMLKNMRVELLKLENRVRFIRSVISGDIKVNNRKRAELFLELKEKNFDAFPKKKNKTEPVAVGAEEEDEENEESPAEDTDGVLGGDYEYLLSMAIGTLTLEKVKQLIAQKDNLVNEVERLSKTDPKSLWVKDLDALEKELDVLDAELKAAEEKRRLAREKSTKDGKASKAAPKRQPKKTAAKSQKANLAGSDDEDYVAAIPKPAAQKKKPAKKVKDAEDEILELKDRLAASNLDSSPEHIDMETETTEGPEKGKKGVDEPSNRGAAKKAMSSLADWSDEEDLTAPIHESEDEGFAMEEVQVEKKTRGRKPAAEKSKPAVRKRAPAQSKGMRQKVMEEIFKPTDDSTTSAPSPVKKVRKMRASPFNKKSGSVFQRVAGASTGTEDTDAPQSGSSAEPVAPRRTARERKAKAIYIDSASDNDDSEDEDVQDLSDESDFDEDED